MVAPLVARAAAGSAVKGAKPKASMPASKFKTELSVSGIDEVLAILDEVTPKKANALMRNTIRGIAADIRKDIMRTAPKSTGDMVKARNIKVKMRRAIKGAVIAEVVFDNKSFYWRFVEHGDAKGTTAQPFVMPARDKAVAEFDTVLTNKFSSVLEKMIARELKKQAKDNQ